MNTTRRLPRKQVQERIRKIAAEVQKKSPITPQELKTIAAKHKYPYKAIGSLFQPKVGYLTARTQISLTTRGTDAAKGKFSKRKR